MNNTLPKPKTIENCILSKKFPINPESYDRGKLVEVNPCTSDKSKVLADVEISQNEEPYFDMEVLSLLMNSYGKHLNAIKCSLVLGLARFMMGNQRIYIYEKGKFKVRQAEDREEVVEILKKLGRAFSGSILCEECGRPALDCIFAVCSSCFSKFTYLNKDSKISSLSDSMDILMNMIGKVRNSDEYCRDKELFVGYFQNAIESSIDILIKTSDLETLNYGNLIIAISRMSMKMVENERMMMESLSDGFENKIDSFHEYVWCSTKNIAEVLCGNIGELKKFKENSSEALEILKEFKGPNVQGLEEIEDQIDQNKAFMRKLEDSLSNEW